MELSYVMIPKIDLPFLIYGPFIDFFYDGSMTGKREERFSVNCYEYKKSVHSTI